MAMPKHEYNSQEKYPKEQLGKPKWTSQGEADPSKLFKKHNVQSHVNLPVIDKKSVISISCQKKRALYTDQLRTLYDIFPLFSITRTNGGKPTQFQLLDNTIVLHEQRMNFSHYNWAISTAILMTICKYQLLINENS